MAEKKKNGKMPSRKETDKLGESYKGKKDWKGDDLSEKDQRFYGVRESGYTGWFDHTTGYPTKGGKW